jgi:hypothetical protein
MRYFQIEVSLGRTQINTNGEEIDLGQIESFLDDSLTSMRGLFDGGGSVRVQEAETGDLDVRLLFAVRGNSKTEVLRRFVSDFELLEKSSRAIAIQETKTFKCVLPKFQGEQFGVFIRVNPETGRPMYTDD